MEGEIIFGGIDGNSQESTIMLFTRMGEVLVMCTGPATNHWEIGMEECQRRLNELVKIAKLACNIPLDDPLTALGLSLSGCEQERTNKELVLGLSNKYPNISKNFYICNDLVGLKATVHVEGGIVVCAKVGSSSILFNMDGTTLQAGGWGHILGDEGSSYWISWRAIKIVYDEQDNFQRVPNGYDIKFVWESIQKYFGIKSRVDILPYIYRDFDKAKLAGLSRRLANGARVGDPLCQHIFQEAGVYLAKLIIALLPKVDERLLQVEGGLHVICVGTVWSYWENLKPGFLKECDMKLKPPIVMSLLQVTAPGASGAAYLAAKAIDYELPQDRKSAYKVFYVYRK